MRAPTSLVRLLSGAVAASWVEPRRRAHVALIRIAAYGGLLLTAQPVVAEGQRGVSRVAKAGAVGVLAGDMVVAWRAVRDEGPPAVIPDVVVRDRE